MASTHDYLALDWVRDEIQETLNQAQQALEAYVENPDDSTRMRFCQTYLHQVYGTLQMVEFYGAALLAEEMEKLAQALLDGQVSQVSDAQETLMRAILQLPPYLDRVQSSRRDLPVVLLPLMNDLRAARGEPLMTETALFKPDIEAQETSGDVPAAVAQDERFAELARKMRQMYQIALLGVIRGDNLAQNLDYMAKVFAKLEQVTGQAKRAPLWRISAALVEGISGGHIERGTSVKMVLGQIDRTLRELTQQGVDSLRQPPPKELLKNLLYYIAKCEADTPRIRQVRETYNLAEALPSEEMIDEERQRMTGPDQAAMGSVVDALSEELTSVKTALEQFVHSEEKDPESLQPQRQTLKQVADTVAMLGLGNPRQLIQDQLEVMDDIIAGNREFSGEMLMDVAGALLYVESTLSGMGQETREGAEAMPEHVVNANSAVVRECRAGLEEAKEGIVEYIASQWNREHLDPVPDKLNAVRGGLEVTHLQRPALILRQCIRYIEENLLIDEPAEPDWRTMDTLADAITGVEYYLERLADDPETTDDILDIARRSVHALGYGLSDDEYGRAEPDEGGGLETAGPAPAGAGGSSGPLDEAASADTRDTIEASLEPQTTVRREAISDIDETDAEAPTESGPVYEEGDDAETAAFEAYDDSELSAEGATDEAGAAETGEADFETEEVELSEPADADEDQAAHAGAEDSEGEALAEPEPEPEAEPEPEPEAAPEAEAPQAETAGTGGAAALPAGHIPEHWVQVEPPPPDAHEEDSDLVDDDIIEIFAEEADEVLEALNEYFPRWAENQSDEEALVEFRRAFHTLKGSGRMVGAHTTGELAWSVENMMNRVIDHTIEPSPELVELVQTVHGLIPDMVSAFSKKEAAPYDVTPLMAAAFTLANGQDIEGVPDVRGGSGGEEAPAGGESAAEASSAAETTGEETPDEAEEITLTAAPEDGTEGEPEEIEMTAAPAGADSTAEADEIEESDPAGAAEELDSSEIDLGEADDADLEEIDFGTAEEIDYGEAAPSEAGTPQDSGEAEEIDYGATPAPGEPAGESEEESGNREVLLEIFSNEAETNLAVVRDWLDKLDRDLSQHPVDDEVHRALHTLKGSARMAEIEPVARVAEPAEKFVKELINTGQPADRDVVTLLEDAVRVLGHAAENPPEGPNAEIEGSGDLLARLHAARERLAPEAEGGAAPEGGSLSGFLDEGMDLIMDSEQRFMSWKANPAPDDTLKTLHDEVAGLAKAGRRANLDEVAALSRPLAECYQAVLDQRVSISDEFLDVAERSHEALMTMMDFLAAGQALRSEDDLIADLRGFLDEGGPEGPGPGAADEAAPSASGAAGESPPAGPDAGAQPQASAEAAPAPEAESVGPDDLDPEMVELFLEEADEVLESASEALEQWQANDDPEPVQGLQRDLHTLKGGARMAGLTPIGNLSHELEDLYEGYNKGQFQADQALFDLLHACQDRLAEMVDGIRSGEGCTGAPQLEEAVRQFLQNPEQPPEIPGTAAAPAAQPQPEPEPEPQPEPEAPAEPEPSAQAEPEPEPSQAPAAAVEEAAPPPPPERDPDLVNIFLEEADEIIESASNELESWVEAPENLGEVQSLQRDLHTLKGGARMAEVPELGNLAHELENLYEGVAQKQLSAEPVLFDLLHRCHDRLAEMVEAVRNFEGIHPPDHLVQAIQDYIRDPKGFTLPSLQPAGGAAPAAQPEPSGAGGQTAAEDEAEQPSADVDKDILDIFMEESGQLGEVIEQKINAWREEPDNPAHRDELARALHTLKGGARLAGLDKLGEISHEFETLLEEQQQKRAPPEESFFDKLDQYQDQIARRMATLREVAAAGGEQPAAAQTQQPQQQQAQAPAQQQTQPQEQSQTQQDTRGKRQTQAQPQEMVRLPADVLESLVNLAGETSINRSRVEQGISEFTLHVEEMGSTVERLYEQLRRLDAETEAQIKANYKQEVEAGELEEGFDPLEMDEYSELNQITKQLSESASDLLDLKQTLLDRTRDTETLLVQQGRINTELQEKLMRTRMVPFSRLVPRLRRIVRQASGEVGKRVNFEVINPEGEMDRTLLERVVAPLEHMLRNAVDHGIEDPGGRQEAGKDESGNVTLELTREGGEVLLLLRDDGKGIDTEKVREKAIERGLMDPNAQMTNQEIQQFIFDAGFSTAGAVTQLSGRGVGMDVVASEIKQMGGSVSIESTKGQGTTFVVRLPFTLAMNRALMVHVGEDAYAIPLNQIEGVVRISPYELEEYLGENGAPYHYAGQAYDLEYLGTYVHGTSGHRFESQTQPLPLLLIRSTEHSVALLVDSLIGSREVVVKSVGPQLSTVAGINGATILGDGSVVIILDIHSLIRAHQLQRQHEALEEQRSFGLTEEEDVPEEAAAEEAAPAEPEEAEKEKAVAPMVMVVDDSVTVRKVTGRLLERHGYEVVTAKDGMDAVAKLEENHPSLMLLDIEMPRMDGFEVASHVRHSDNLNEVPIIMITSRTGEKHRERAFDIGVNAYMGKPFQEGELLNTVADLLGVSREAADS